MHSMQCYLKLATDGTEAMASQSRVFSLLDAANDEDFTPMLHKTMLSIVKKKSNDLTARQLGIFLTVYLDKGPHTVRSLAMLFGICKSAVTRSLDRLGELDLARRKVDPRDRRSVLVQRTELGWTFVGELRREMAQAMEDAEWAAASRVEARAWPGSVPMNRAGFGHALAANSHSD